MCARHLATGLDRRNYSVQGGDQPQGIEGLLAKHMQGGGLVKAAGKLLVRGEVGGHVGLEWNRATDMSN